MYADFIKIYKYLSKIHPEEANEILYSLVSIDRYIDKCKSKINEDIKVAVDKDEDLTGFIKYKDTILSISEKIKSDIEELHKASKLPMDIIDTEDDQLIFDNSSYNNDIEWLSLNYDFQSTKVNRLQFKGKQYEVKNLAKALVKICKLLYLEDKSKFKKMVVSDLAHGQSVDYFTKIPKGREYCAIPNTNTFVLIQSNSNAKIKFIKAMLDYYGFDYNTVMLSIRDKHTSVNIDKKKSNNGVRIGEYVKSKMRYLSDIGYNFDEATLAAITDVNLSKQLIDVNYALLVSYEDAHSGKIKRERYWKDIFIFNGQKYYVTSQWFVYMKDGFDKWYKSLKS